MSFDFKNLYKTRYTQGGFLYTLAGLLSESHLSIKPDFLQLPTIQNHFRFVIKPTRSKFSDSGKMPRYEHSYPLDLEHPPKDPTRRLGPQNVLLHSGGTAFKRWDLLQGPGDWRHARLKRDCWTSVPTSFRFLVLTVSGHHVLHHHRPRATRSTGHGLKPPCLKYEPFLIYVGLSSAFLMVARIRVKYNSMCPFPGHYQYHHED